MKQKYEGTDLKNSKLHKSRFEMIRRDESFADFSLKTSMAKSMLNCHPGEITNMPMSNNFPWQLKKNLRYTYDYVGVSESVYKRLLFVFEGGPNY